MNYIKLVLFFDELYQLICS